MFFGLITKQEISLLFCQICNVLFVVIAAIFDKYICVSTQSSTLAGGMSLYMRLTSSDIDAMAVSTCSDRREEEEPKCVYA